MRLSAATIALMLMGSGPAALAGAEDSADVWLRWARGEGAETCPTADEFASKVAAHLGKPPAIVTGAAKSTLSARIDVSLPNPGHARDWVAEAKLLDDSGTVTATRRISKTAETCGPISDALALVTAIVLSSTAAPDVAQGDDATEKHDEPPAPEQPPEGHPAHEPVALPPAPAPRTWHAKIEAGPSLQIGRLPGVSLAGEAQAFLGFGRWPTLFADFAYWPETRADSSPGGAQVGLWTAGLGLCPVGGRTTPRLYGLCVGADVGRLHAAGFGFDTSGTINRWVVDLTIAGRFEQRLGGHFFVSANLVLAIPLVRTRVAYSTSTGETQVVFQAWPTTAMCHVGLGYAFD
jgi:hypothetical protein